MSLAAASITGSLVNLATHLINSLGLGGVAVLTASSGVIGIPGSEPTMLFAGFNVFQGHLSLLGIILAGVLGDMVGASVAYAIGYFGSRELLERQGRKLHVSGRRLDTAHRWFDRYGDPVILVSRLIPFVRAAFPYAAGVAEMAFARFLAWAALGSVIWISALAVLGREVGRNWTHWRSHLEYADYVAVALALLVIAYLVLRRLRSRPSRRPTMDVVSK
ncbi:MAG: DedA family protein [Solirubrobacterales bacterium]|nr:DedA family protein [Solirubrobacterales bacterium]MBV9716527.1 DedA family protein [Solirubrobacterales bacterium]